MSARGAARQYANALFDVASKNGTVDRVGRDLGDFASLVASHAELRRALGSPAVPVAQKRGVVQAVLAAAGGLSPETGRLLDLLAGRDRLGLIEDVLAAFGERAMAARNVVTAEVTTAVPLSDAHRTALAAALGKAVDREVTVTERVDPSIIGGVIARVGSVVFDGSVTRQIERMHETLVAGA